MEKIKIKTKGQNEIIDLTPIINKIIEKTKIENGLVSICSSGSTVGITTIEYEPELLKDFQEFLEKIIPSSQNYRHNQVWGERNGFSHLRSSLFRPFLTVPLEKGKLILGQWQNIVLIDFDNRPREREIFVKIIQT